MLEILVFNLKYFKAFVTRSVSEIRMLFRLFSLGKEVIFSEKYPQSQCHVSVSQAVDESVQHGGDHCVHHGSKDVFVMGLA